MKFDLPTCVASEFTTASLLTELTIYLTDDRKGGLLRVYAYAVTSSGWNLIAGPLGAWMKRTGGAVEMYAGTDHALTTPSALDVIRNSDVSLYILKSYRGTFHPKVFWLAQPSGHILWAGSNNLTSDGLRNNFEFATVTRSRNVPPGLYKWHKVVAAASILASDSDIASYKAEYDRYQQSRYRAKIGTFVWSKRRSMPVTSHPRPRIAALGSLIVEVMPKETGSDGSQIQLPMGALVFFGVGDATGATRTATFVEKAAGLARDLTMRVNDNRTYRLSIQELQPRSRPCVIVFRRSRAGHFEFEIVQRAVDPDRYLALLALCGKPTRKGSRHWTVVRATP